MEFIDRNGDEVLSLPSFSILPKHVVQLIISRESLAVSEVSYEYLNLHFWLSNNSKSLTGYPRNFNFLTVLTVNSVSGEQVCGCIQLEQSPVWERTLHVPQLWRTKRLFNIFMIRSSLFLSEFWIIGELSSFIILKLRIFNWHSRYLNHSTFNLSSKVRRYRRGFLRLHPVPQNPNTLSYERGRKNISLLSYVQNTLADSILVCQLQYLSLEVER